MHGEVEGKVKRLPFILTANLHLRSCIVWLPYPFDSCITWRNFGKCWHFMGPNSAPLQDLTPLLQCNAIQSFGIALALGGCFFSVHGICWSSDKRGARWSYEPQEKPYCRI